MERARSVSPAALVSLGIGLLGCAATAETPDEQAISHALESRTGSGVRLAEEEAALPPGVELADGISPEEAVAVALWRNPAFLEALAELEVSRAEVLEAGLFRDPAFAFLFPLGPKQYEWTITVPLQDLWQRPHRLEMARLDAERVAQLLVQEGLDLVRDVQVLHARWSVAREHARLGAERADVEARLADLARERLAAGDVSPLETRAQETRAEQSRLTTQRLTAEAEAARARFWARLGLEHDSPALPAVAPPPPAATHLLAELQEQAFASRPDLRAAELAVEAAAEQVGLAKSELWQVSAILDANEVRDGGMDAGPGFSTVLPLFTGSRGKSAKARAELDRAARHYVTVRHAIALEVHEAALALEESERAHAAWRDRILPGLVETASMAEAALAAGDVAPSVLWEARLDLTEGRMLMAEGEAELANARADLERSIGGRPHARESARTSTEGP